MSEPDYYDIVRQKVCYGPLQYPKHELIFKLMKVFWNEEDIKLLSHFPNAGEVISLQELVEKSGVPKDQVKKIIKNAAKKRTILKKGKYYGLEPLLPGIFEAYFIVRQDSEENLKKAAKIYRQIFEHASELQEEREYKLFSPILPVEATEKLIAVDKTVDAETKVLPYELVEEMINKNEHFAVIPCQCRLISELSGDPCKVAPAEMGCFVVGPSAMGLVSMGLARSLASKEEAIDYLKKTEKAGLVHNASNDTSENTFICNCCSCHCGVLFPMKEFNIKHVRPSNFKPKINRDLCVVCKTCLKKCPLEAITHQEDEDKMVVEWNLCIGCGVCAANCAKNAIFMEKVDDVIPRDKNRIKDKTFGEMLEELLMG